MLGFEKYACSSIVKKCQLGEIFTEISDILRQMLVPILWHNYKTNINSYYDVKMSDLKMPVLASVDLNRAVLKCPPVVDYI